MKKDCLKLSNVTSDNGSPTARTEEATCALSRDDDEALCSVSSARGRRENSRGTESSAVSLTRSTPAEDVEGVSAEGTFWLIVEDVSVDGVFFTSLGSLDSCCGNGKMSEPDVTTAGSCVPSSDGAWVCAVPACTACSPSIGGGGGGGGGGGRGGIPLGNRSSSSRRTCS